MSPPVAPASPSPTPDRSAANPPPALGPGYDRIIETVFSIPDPGKTFLELREQLQSQVPPSESDYGRIVNELDVAERRAQLAYELLAHAKVAYELFKIDANVIESALRNTARERLDAEKKEGTRKKDITETDVKSEMVTQFPDEVRDLAARRARAEGAIESIASVAERWKERVRDLRVMTQNVRGA